MNRRDRVKAIVGGAAAGLAFSALAGWLSHILYFDTSLSPIPYYTSLFVGFAVLSITTLYVLKTYWTGRETVIQNGIASTVILGSLFFFFSIFTFFFYFLFAPLPTFLKVIGLSAGVIGHAWWFWLTKEDLHRATKKTCFMDTAFEVGPGQLITYNPNRVRNQLSRNLTQRNVPQQGQFWAALLIAPAAPFLSGLFVNDLKVLGISTIIAYLSIPIGLWFLRVLIIVSTLTLYFPFKLRIATGKEVVFGD